MIRTLQPEVWRSLQVELSDRGVIAVSDPAPVSGGDIADAWRVDTRDGTVFLKTLRATESGVLAAEAEGLEAIRQTETLRVPAVIGHGQADSLAWLALEWLEFGRGGDAVQSMLGAQLAALHRHTAPQHGWPEDNWIGRTPQPNGWHDDWVTFFAEHRLGHQVALATEAGFGNALAHRAATLLERLPDLLSGHTPAPSLLHGDLWGGNWSSCDGAPVVYDPAAYYGDREADLAMTRLFGGFSGAFYAAYEAAWPLPAGHAQRDVLYRLYHVLNHVNLFGGGYVTQAMSLIDQLIAPAR